MRPWPSDRRIWLFPADQASPVRARRTFRRLLQRADAAYGAQRRVVLSRRCTAHSRRWTPRDAREKSVTARYPRLRALEEARTLAADGALDVDLLLGKSKYRPTSAADDVRDGGVDG
ncbi:hypothetical protein [Streptomyces sp. NPDC059850]|uniref:hypothetical protein n=1 Tax=Streptomyces sp. NPDC059850 TaxID=3346970 RepID=UPI0036563C39